MLSRTTCTCYILVLSIFVNLEHTIGLSDKRLCADPKCQEIISLGTAAITYPAGEEGMVSFKINSQIRVKSKGAGKDPSLWFIEVNGREGYAPKKYIKELKIIHKDTDLKFEVPVLVPGIKPSETDINHNPYDATKTNNDAEELNAVLLENDVKRDIDTTIPSNILPNQLKSIDSTPVLENEIIGGTQLPAGEEPAQNDAATIIINNHVEVASNEDSEEGKKVESIIEIEHKPVHKIIDVNNNEINYLEDTEEDDVEEIIEDTDDIDDFNSKKDNSSNDAVNSINSEQQIEDLSLEDAVRLDDAKQIVNNNKNDVQLNNDRVLNEKKSTEREEIYKRNTNESAAIDSLTKQQEVTIEEIKNDTIVDVGGSTEEVPPFATESNISQSKALYENPLLNVTENISTAPASEKSPPFDNQNSEKIGIEIKETIQIETSANEAASADNLEIAEQKTKKDEDLLTANEVTVKTKKSDIYIQEMDDTKETRFNKVTTETESTRATEVVAEVTGETETSNQKFSIAKEEDSISSTASLVETTLPSIVDDKQKLNEEDVISATLPEIHTVTQPVEKLTNKVPEISEQYTPASMPEENIYHNLHKSQEYQQHTDKPIEWQAMEPEFREQSGFREPSEQITESKLTQKHEIPTNALPVIKSEYSSEPVTEPAYTSVESSALPSKGSADGDEQKQRGLFATILDTVNSLLPTEQKNKIHEGDDSELQRILFSTDNGNKIYSESLVNTHQQQQAQSDHYSQHHYNPPDNCQCVHEEFSWEQMIENFGKRMLELRELLACLTIAATTTLFFIFGYYCFCNSSREGALLSKLNLLERSLLATHKENVILKHDLTNTRSKLCSIEDNSFGSNDMVISLKQELEEEMLEKRKLQEQVGSLEKELENAAEAGLELNRIVSELLSNQSGDESIISSVEELQKQLNEQQETILEINATLAEKSRENSELQMLIAEQSARLEAKLKTLQQDNDELDEEKSSLQTRIEELKSHSMETNKAIDNKNHEIKHLQNEIEDLRTKLEQEHNKWQTSLAKVEALEECLKAVKKDGNVNISEVIDMAYTRAELLEIQKKCSVMKEQLDFELDAKRRAESQLQTAISEIEKFKQDYHQTEKDKLEAQTRLEVLSNYFKEKETQLQKELSLKEAMWLKQQGEATSTVDRLTAMQEELQLLRSQNDSLRAEIEAQTAAHKAQIGTLENRAHESWLAARQCERKYDEARAEAATLRRKLTTIAGVNPNELNSEGKLSSDMNSAPSPIHMESPGSPMLGRLPPPFLPPPFMGAPPPFLGMPPPFLPPGEMRPAPLGRIMSPPPAASVAPHHPNMHLARYSPDPDEYDDYDDDEEEELHRRRRSDRNERRNSWHRDTYSPPPRTYHPHSPADSRYDYPENRDHISTYDTETDFSPPPSPHMRRGRYKAYSPPPPNHSSTIGEYSNRKAYSSGSKGALSSGSEKSSNSFQHSKGKSKV